MSIVPAEWRSEYLGESPDGEDWTLKVEHDLMKDGDPLVVTMDGMVAQAGAHEEGFVICLCPGKAREVAAALLVYAHLAQQENERRANA